MSSDRVPHSNRSPAQDLLTHVVMFRARWEMDLVCFPTSPMSSMNSKQSHPSEEQTYSLFCLSGNCFVTPQHQVFKWDLVAAFHQDIECGTACWGRTAFIISDRHYKTQLYRENMEIFHVSIHLIAS